MTTPDSSEITSHSNTSGPDAFRLVRAAIEVHGQDLAGYPGVVSVRPGYRFRAGYITDQAVVSVSVLEKKDVGALEMRNLLPQRLGKVLVDVIPASPSEQLHAARTRVGSLVTAEAAREVTRLAQGTGIVDLRSPLERWNDDTTVVSAEAAGRAYPRPDRLPEEVDEHMTLICHASPDAAWRLLKQFLESTQRDLTATMYEFTAKHILETLLQTLQSPKTFHFVMDFEREKSGLDNPQVLQQLASQLGDRLTFAWAPVVRDRVTTVGYFPSAYHIKVAVRDEKAVWLSSGNWKPSNQPTIDPLDPPVAFDEKTFRAEHNRDWHIIAESPALARQFKYFIDHDLQLARQVQAAGPEAVNPASRSQPDLFVPSITLESRPGAKFFKELQVHKQIRIRPLLTPDNYITHILPLVKGATHRVWFQNQSLSPSQDKPQYVELFNVLRDLSQNPAMDTRIIFRSDFTPYEKLQILKESGFNTSRIRLQPGCHTKGIIIDNVAVVVGSHNWTGAGVLENRDASLIIYDAEVITYFASLFEHDWDHLASTRVPVRETIALIAPQEEPAPPDMVRVPWSFLED